MDIPNQNKTALVKKYKKYSNLELNNFLYNDPYDKELLTVIDHRIIEQSSIWFKIKKYSFLLSLLSLVLSLFYSSDLQGVFIYLDNIFIFGSIITIFYTINDYFNSLSPLNLKQNNY